MNISSSVQAEHLRRRAVIYVRQSSPNQVLNHQESQRLQYALTEHARQLGWHDRDIAVIDRDLGRSAASIEHRVGFQEMVAQVGLKQVGILFAYDATRLARNCTHWYQLLDLCGRVGCLIADQDGVYDPGSINGRLLLGLKGQIAELELHTIRARLTAGILSKAGRGELALMLPTGLERLPSGEVVQHPDREVRDRLALVFELLLEKKSLAQLLRHLRQHDLKVPRRDQFGDIHWKRPTVASLRGIVTNPAYAGAFVYGRTRARRSENTGKTRQTPLPMEQWRIRVPDKYPAYVTWQTFEKIQAMLRDNHAEYDRNKTRGVPREGKALLQGLIYCGECGHKMALQYKGGTQYLCNHLRQQHGEPVCQRLPADPIDEQVIQWFFETLSLAQIDVAARVLQEADQQRDKMLSCNRQQVQRLRYQEQLAQRQFQRVDPDNRLVAAELEQRWEQTLRELKKAEEDVAQQEQTAPCWAIPADLLAVLQDLGSRLPEVWNQAVLTSSRKKALLRSLIDKVVLRRVASDRVMTRVVWRGGATTSQEVRVSVGSLARLSDGNELEQAVLDLARAGKSDARIAKELTRRGHRSPRHDTVLPSTVKNIRLGQGVMLRPSQSHPRRVPGRLTIPQLAKKLGVSRYWIHDRVHNGTIQVTKDARTQCYLFPDNPDTIRQFRQLLAGEISELGC